VHRWQHQGQGVAEQRVVVGQQRAGHARRDAVDDGEHLVVRGERRCPQLGQLEVVAVQPQLLAQHVSDAGGIQLTAVTPVHDARAVEPFIDLGGL
jgi:hypothetical protein